MLLLLALGVPLGSLISNGVLLPSFGRSGTTNKRNDVHAPTTLAQVYPPRHVQGVGRAYDNSHMLYPNNSGGGLFGCRTCGTSTAHGKQPPVALAGCIPDGATPSSRLFFWVL